jgi:hypothetical protein
MPGWFKPLYTKPKIRELVAFDIEGGGGYSGFTCGAIVSDSIYSFYTNREDMFERLQEYARNGAWVFSHNLQYDLPLLEGYDFPRGDLLFTKHSLLWATYTHKKRKCKFYDSTNLFPKLSVDYLGDMVSLPKVVLPDSLLRRLAGGQEWEHFTQDEQDAIRKRVEVDAEILFLAVASLQELILRLGGQLKPTIAGCAMDIYRRKYHRWPWQVLGPATNKLARPGFYGGRVENFAFGKVEHCNLYDVTSLYPYAQSIARYPHPGHLKLDFPTRATGKWLDWEGVLEGVLNVPETFIPNVPYRYDKKLFFPVGRMRGVWTLFDIRHAIHAGATLESCNWILGTPVTFNPFGAFVEQLFEMRLGYLDAGSPQANLVKLLLNSLYGRWGLNEEGGLYTIASLDGEIDWEKFRGYETQTINGKVYAFGQLGNTHQPDYVNVLFAAQITSEARSILNNELSRQGESAAYCDTDSILTTGIVQETNQLGGWRSQMTDGQADLLGPKEYALHNMVLGDRYVVKGLPESVAQTYFQEGAARYYRALSIREAINRGQEPTSWVETLKSHQATIPKRQPIPPLSGEPSECYSSRPYRVADLHYLMKEQGFHQPQPVSFPKRVFRGRRVRKSHPKLAKMQ